MKNIKWLLVLIFPVIVFSSCQKDDDKDDQNNTPSLTNTEKIARTWVMTEGIVEAYNNNTLVSTENLMNTLDPCDSDDEITFTENGTFQETEGETKCDPNNPDLIDFGTWAFSNDETTLLLTYNDDVETQPVSIVSLTATQMKLTATEEDGNETYISKVTFSAK